MIRDDLAVFALNETEAFGRSVAEVLGVCLTEHEEREFRDGEHRIRALESVRQRDVYVIQSLYGDSHYSVNDKLCRLLFFLGSLRDAGAACITAVVPYLSYARQDYKAKPREPVTTRYVARLFEAAGADRVVTLGVHNLFAFQNAFRILTEHLDAQKLFVQHFRSMAEDSPIVIVSPNIEGLVRADAFCDALSLCVGKPLPVAIIEEHREAGVHGGDVLVGNVDGRNAIVFTDLINGGTTVARAVEICHARGAQRVFVAATHGLFLANSERVLSAVGPDRIVVTNTIPPFRLSTEFVQTRIDVIDAAPLFGEAIRRIHSGGSLAELLDA